MIRKQTPNDLQTICNIWLNTNISAHPFIPSSYWNSMLPVVSRMFEDAEIYVYEKEGNVLGFIGLDGSYIAGIFVTTPSQGIGKQLLNFVKEKNQRLELSVYQENHRAIQFYKHHGFVIQSEGTDEATGAKEYTMQWMQQ